MFIENKPIEGKYTVQLFSNGQAKLIEISDYFPCDLLEVFSYNLYL